MKRILLILSIAFTSFVANAQFIKASVQVSGLTCSMCSFATQKQLQKLDFIDSIGTDLQHATFLLYFKKGKTVNIDQIKTKVEDAGFSVASLKIYFEFTNYTLSNNQHFVYEKNMFHFLNGNNQTLSGMVALKIIDKGFLSEKEYRQYRQQHKQTPFNESSKTPDVNRVYHVSIQ